MSQPFKLYRLQQIDSQLDRVRNRLHEIEILINENATLQEAQRRTADAEAELEARRKSLHRAEQESQDQRVKIEQTEATLYGGRVHNPKELQDLQNETAALKRFQSVLEDRQLEAMLLVEEAEEALQQAVKAQEEIQAAFDHQNQGLAKERESLQGELVRSEGERDATQSSIPVEDLDLYEKLRHQRRGVAVAKVTDKACSACGSVLSAALLYASRSPTTITRCSTCGRILYAG